MIQLIKAEEDRKRLVQANPSVFLTTSQEGSNSEVDTNSVTEVDSENGGGGHANAMHSVRVRSRQKDDTVEFEWDSDSSHHFTGSLIHYIPDTFVQRRMRVYVADGKGCWAEGYGSFPHPMLKKVWYVPKFKGRPN